MPIAIVHLTHKRPQKISDDRAGCRQINKRLSRYPPVDSFVFDTNKKNQDTRHDDREVRERDVKTRFVETVDRSHQRTAAAL